jgi:predicted nucleic acid-binding protein
VKDRCQFIYETTKLLKLKLLKIVLIKTRLAIQAWPIIEKYHVYEADALQVVSAKHVGAEKLYTGDKQVHEVAAREGISTVYLGRAS